MSDHGMTHDDLVARAKTFLVNDLGCGVAFVEFHAAGVVTTHGVPDALGFRSFASLSVQIECKTSRSDFFRDQQKAHKRSPVGGLGNVRYYMVPRGLIDPPEVPDGWGLIECYEHAGRVAANRTHGPRGQLQATRLNDTDYWHESDRDAERRLMYSALRRLELRGLVDRIYEPPGS